MIGAATGGSVVSSGNVKGISPGMQSFLKGSYHENFGKLFLSSVGQDAQEHPLKYAAAGIAITALNPAVGAEMKILLGIAASACKTVDAAQHY